MMKKMLIGLGVLSAAFVGVVVAQPSTYHVERSIHIDAPADVVLSEVNDFNNWEAWDTWKKEDPSQTTTVEGEPGVAGHVSRWSGESAGEGSMTIVDVSQPNRVAMEVQFVRPVASTAKSAIQLTPDPTGEGLEATWTLEGQKGFMGKLAGLFSDDEAALADRYQHSLATLKTVSEEKARKLAELAAAMEGDPAAADGQLAAPADPAMQ